MPDVIPLFFARGQQAIAHLARPCVASCVLIEGAIEQRKAQALCRTSGRVAAVLCTHAQGNSLDDSRTQCISAECAFLLRCL